MKTTFTWRPSARNRHPSNRSLLRCACHTTGSLPAREKTSPRLIALTESGLSGPFHRTSCAEASGPQMAATWVETPLWRPCQFSWTTSGLALVIQLFAPSNRYTVSGWVRPRMVRAPSSSMSKAVPSRSTVPAPR